MLMIIIAILLVTIVLLIITCANMYRKLGRYEDWTFEIRKQIYKIFNTMKFLDNKQMFEKDDDVGRLWEVVKETINKIDDFIVPDGLDEDDEENKELEIE